VEVKITTPQNKEKQNVKGPKQRSK